MKERMLKAPWQYFSVDLTNPKRKALFNLDTCESCNRLVLAPNSIWGFDSIRTYHALNMMEMDWEHYVKLSELGYSEKIQAAVCQECWDEDIENNE